MTNALHMMQNVTVRALIQGWPKSGKTGALVPLVEAGFKIRLLDYNSNPEVMLFNVRNKAMLANVDIVQLRDRFVDSNLTGLSAVNSDSFTRGLEMLKHWEYTADDGTEVDLGQSKDWGRDTIVVLDTLNDMGISAKLRAMRIMNKTRRNNSQPSWGFAMEDLANVVRLLCDPNNKFHVLIMSHLRMIGPEPINDDDDDTTKEQKTLAANLVPTRLYPTALGKQLPQVIAGFVPIVLNAEVMEWKGKERRVFNADPTMSTSTGCPVPGIKWPLPAETALLTVFQAMGVPLPNGEGSEQGNGSPTSDG